MLSMMDEWVHVMRPNFPMLMIRCWPNERLMIYGLLLLWHLEWYSFSLTVDELKHQIHRCQPDKNDVRMMCRVFFFMFSYRILIFCVQKFHLRFTKTRIGQLSLSEIFVSVRIISCFVCFVCVARMCLYRYIQYTVYVSGSSTQTHVSIN